MKLICFFIAYACLTIKTKSENVTTIITTASTEPTTVSQQTTKVEKPTDETTLPPRTTKPKNRTSKKKHKLKTWKQISDIKVNKIKVAIITAKDLKNDTALKIIEDKIKNKEKSIVSTTQVNLASNDKVDENKLNQDTNEYSTSEIDDVESEIEKRVQASEEVDHSNLEQENEMFRSEKDALEKENEKLKKEYENLKKQFEDVTVPNVTDSHLLSEVKNVDQVIDDEVTDDDETVDDEYIDEKSIDNENVTYNIVDNEAIHDENVTDIVVDNKNKSNKIIDESNNTEEYYDYIKESNTLESKTKIPVKVVPKKVSTTTEKLQIQLMKALDNIKSTSSDDSASGDAVMRTHDDDNEDDDDELSFNMNGENLGESWIL